MKGLETLERQRLFLKAIGIVLANEDLGLIKDSGTIKYGTTDGIIFDLNVGFSSYYTAELGEKIIAECKKLGLQK